MRELPASHFRNGRRGPPIQLRPREGTKLRAMYDLLMANKGIPLEVTLTLFQGAQPGRGDRMISDLRDYYGLDIRKLGYGRWVLAGEWFGPTYVDYIADRIAKSEGR